ncbi:MAG: methyltransferase domain-containing protein [Phycisphaerales bacterium]
MIEIKGTSPMHDLISKEYAHTLREMHEDHPNWGRDGAKWLDAIISRLYRIPAITSILDYGCGKGAFKIEMRQHTLGERLTIVEYDPGIKDKSSPPIMPCDLVVCTDVMEHVEEDKVAGVIAHIASLTAREAFFVINTRPARAVLPDGRNAHICQRNTQWWLEQLDDHLQVRHWYETKKELVVWCRK